MTPWFAAGAGFVLAAGLWIYSPHTELKFPTATTPFGLPCTAAQCGGGGQAATSTPGKRIIHHAGSRPGVHSDVAGQHSATAGLTFSFVVQSQGQDGFQALITVRGQRVPSTWLLEFRMPGTHIRYVLGAEWRALPAGDGGTASAAQGQFGGGGQGNGQSPGGDGQDLGSQGDISFLVVGSGSASTPTTCVFNGASCTFN